MLKVIGNFNLGSDAVLNNVNGKQVINFNACHSDSYKDQQGNTVDRSTWVSCSWWVERTGILQYLKKGTSVLIDGTPSATVYKNKQGESVAQLQIRVNSLQLIGGSKPKETTTDVDKQSSTPPSSHDPVNADDLPF